MKRKIAIRVLCSLLVMSLQNFGPLLGQQNHTEQATLALALEQGITFDQSHVLSAGPAVCRLANGDVIQVNSYQPSGKSDTDIHLLKTNQYGDTIWSQTIGSTHHETAFAVQETLPEQGFLIAGESRRKDEPGTSDMYIIKTDISGKVMWKRRITKGGSNAAIGIMPFDTANQGYLVLGRSAVQGAWSDKAVTSYSLIKLDFFGKVEWMQRMADSIGMQQQIKLANLKHLDPLPALCAKPSQRKETVIMHATKKSLDQFNDAPFVSKMQQEAMATAPVYFKLYPNPAGQYIFMQAIRAVEGDSWINVYDLKGRMVYQRKIWAGHSRIRLDIGDLSAGMYEVIYIDANKILGQAKFIKE